MWNYEKRLEYPINIKRTDAAMAKAIISQFGDPDGETGAAMRYLSQRFAMPYRPVMGILTDIGTEASKYEFVDLVQTKKEILAYPICSIVAVFKMLVHILNTLRSRIWDMPVFLFSDYTKSTVGENGDCPEVYGFHWNETPDGDIFLRNYKDINSERNRGNRKNLAFTAIFLW